MKTFNYFTIALTCIVFLIFQPEMIGQDLRSSLPGIDNTKDFLTNPSTSEFTDYSNQEYVDLYTGMVNYTIPIYSIEQKDLKVPINLNYKSDGVLIEQDASWVGLGWNLSGVSYIKREVKGNPDEAIKVTSNQGYEYYQNFGRFYGLIAIENDSQEIPLGNSGGQYIMDDYVDMIINNDLFTCDLNTDSNIDQCEQHCQLKLVDKIVVSDGASIPGGGVSQIFWNRHRDTEPDIFRYSVPSATGTFILDKNGNPKIISGSTDVIIKPAIGPLSNSNGWEIITSNGVIHTFPNQDNYTETTTNSSLGWVNCSSWADEKETKQQFKNRSVTPLYEPIPGDETNNMCLSRIENTVVNAWYLSKMKSVKYEEEINFTYHSQGAIENYKVLEQKMEYIETYQDTYSGVDLCYPQSTFRPTNTSIIRSFPTNSNIYNIYAKPNKSYWNPSLRTVKNPKYLKSITFSEGKINFSLSSTNRLDMPQNKALNKIQIIDNSNKKIKEFSFDYDYFKSTPTVNDYRGHRLKLNGFAETPNGETLNSKSFLFEYNESYNLPPKGTNKIDFWGYFNNNSGNSLIPETKRKGITFNGANRAPNEARMKTGMLNKITYPTGGHTNIFYEINRYREKEYNLELPIGGLRVSRTLTHDGVSTGNDIIKNYEYGETNFSSGRSVNFVDRNWWRHYQQDSYITYGHNANRVDRHFFIKRSSHNLYTFERTKGGLVGYEKVTVSSPGKGKTEYRFNSPEGFPDEKGQQIKYPTRNENGSDGYHDLPHISNDAIRGLIKRITSYNESGDLVSFENYEYENNPLRHNQTVLNTLHIKKTSDQYARWNWANHSAGFITYSPEVYNYILNIGGLKSWFPYLKRKIVRNYDTAGSDYVEIISTFDKNSQEHMQVTNISVSNTDHIQKSNLYYSTDTYPLNDLNSPELVALDLLRNQNRIEPVYMEEYSNSYLTKRSRHLFKKNNDTNKIVVKEKQISKGSGDFYSSELYKKYDVHGNLVESCSPDGMNIIYVWGYNNKYPIVKIENATYESMPNSVSTLINQIKSNSNTENTKEEEHTLRSLFDDLRNDNYFSTAMVYTYTFDPLVGMTSMTDSRGYTFYYEYDEFNRLKATKDDKGNVLTENKYNYGSQN